jgi:hypothetical protein
MNFFFCKVASECSDGMVRDILFYEPFLSKIKRIRGILGTCNIFVCTEWFVIQKQSQGLLL